MLVNSEATNYMIKDQRLFVELNRSKKGTIGSADSQSTFEGKGKVKFTTESSDGDELTVELKDALFVPNYAANLVSVGKLKKAGVTIHFGGDDFLETTGGTRFPIKAAGRLFVWKLKKTGRECIETGEMALASLKDWHERLGHNNLEDVKRLPQHVEGMQITSSEWDSCRECLLNKSKREAVSKDVSTRTQQKLEIVHEDLLGPINLVAVDGQKYAIGFIDSYTRMVKVYVMKSRDEVLGKTKRYFAEVGALKTLVTDGAKEFVSRDMRSVRRKQGTN